MTNFSFKVFSIFTTLFIGLSMYSCQNAKSDSSSQAQFEAEHSAKNSLDWSGKYSGELPCEGCDHLSTELSITDSQSYVLVLSKLSGEEKSLDTMVGKFEWQGNNIQLLGINDPAIAAMYKVEENRLRQLDSKGQKIEGAQADQYLLAKEGNLAVEDKRWRLVELNGKPIDGKADRHYLIFHSHLGRIEAKADCNILGFMYKIRNNDQVLLQQGFSTMMACPDDTEQDFVAAINQIDQLTTDGQTLSLQKSGANPNLKFELVQE